jgi:HTH-type transcriptional regulator/antitoxin HigA
MITNELQYRSTKSLLAQFEEAIANLEARGPKSKRTKRDQLEIDAVASQAEDLRAEIEEYERLRSGRVSTLEASSLAGLATLLIKARIARGWTQQRLAEELGVAEQQVQRYEATEYRSASLARICDVADALGVEVTETAQLRDPDAA